VVTGRGHDPVVSSSGARAGILVITVWFEGDVDTGFRARIVRSMDALRPERVESAVSSAEDALATVREWLVALAPG
jgi:hypothetical protein